MNVSDSGTVAADVDQERIPNGTIIAGRYRIDKWLGRGGMGAVYQTQDLKEDRRVALKLLHRALDRDPNQVKRFRREARILGRLRSAHVVAVYDHGRTDDGLLYLVMEYLEGETLRQRLDRRGALPVAEALTIMVAVLDGLAAVHRAGVTHRDVKPANIFLASLPGGGYVAKLLDFGIAKMDSSETTELTKAGLAVGTPRFMSPEQVLGHTVDHRSDLYSVAVVLYLAVSGVMPYESGTYAQMLYTLMQSAPVPLTRRRTQLESQSDLNRIVLHALERSPDARYQSAQEMAAELRVLLNAEQPSPGRSGLWLRRLTPPASRAGVVVVLICTMIAFLELTRATRIPFAGFLTIGPLVSANLPSEIEGHGVVTMRDQIVAINGQPWRSSSETRAYLARLPLGAPVEYRLRYGAQERTVTMHVTKPTWRLLRDAYAIHYLAGLLLILVGALVAWSRPHLAGARALFLTNSALGLAMVTTRDRDFGDPLELLALITTSYIGIAFTHLALVYPSQWAPIQRRPWWIVGWYGFGAVIATTGIMGLHNPIAAHVWTRVNSVSLFAAITLLLVRQNRLRKQGATVAIRQSARQMLLAATPLVFLGVIGLIIGLTGLGATEGYLVMMIGLTLFPLVIGYQIRSGELFDLDLMFARLIRALLRYALLVVIFGTSMSVVLAMTRLFGSGPTVERVLVPTIGIAVVSLVYDPLMRRMSDRLKRDGSDSAAVISQFSSALHNLDEYLDVIGLLFETLRHHFRPQTLRLLEREGNGYTVRSVDDSTLTRPALVADVMFELEGSDLSDKAEQPLSPVELARHISRFGRLRAHAGLILPVAESSTMTASQGGSSYRRVLVLGPRVDGQPYSGDDAGLVAALVHLAAAESRKKNLDSATSLNTHAATSDVDAMADDK